MKPSKINMNQDKSQGRKRPLDISLLVHVILMEKLTCISALVDIYCEHEHFNIYCIPNTRIFMERPTVVVNVNTDGLCASKNNTVCFSGKSCEKVHHI